MLVCGRTLVLLLLLLLLLPLGLEVLLLPRAGSEERSGPPRVNVSGCSEGRGLRPVPSELWEVADDAPDRRCCCCWPAGYALNPGVGQQ